MIVNSKDCAFRSDRNRIGIFGIELNLMRSSLVCSEAQDELVGGDCGGKTGGGVAGTSTGGVVLTVPVLA
jgi:hypothetical protein